MTNEELLCVLLDLKMNDSNFSNMLANNNITFPQKDEAFLFFTADGWIDCLSEEQLKGFA